MTSKRSKRTVADKKKVILDEDDELNDLSEEEETKVDEDSDYEEESKKKKSKKDNKKESKKETKKETSKKESKKDSKKESSKKESKKKETKQVKKKETKKETKASSSEQPISTTKGLLPFKLKLGFTKGKRKRSFRQIVSKQDLASEDVDEDNLESEESSTNQQQNLTYSSIQVGSFSLYPKPKYCDITGLLCKYTNPHNKLQYHSSCINPLISSLSDEKIQQYLSVRTLK